MKNDEAEILDALEFNVRWTMKYQDGALHVAIDSPTWRFSGAGHAPTKRIFAPLADAMIIAAKLKSNLLHPSAGIGALNRNA